MVADGLPAGRLARVAEFGRIAEAAHAALSSVLRTPAELEAGSWLLLETLDAVVLLERPGFLGGRLGAMADRLRACGGRRRVYRGAWRWQIAPDPPLLRLTGP